MQAEVKAQESALPPIVLLVEDDPDTRELYETALGLSGLWVAQARDGQDAVEYAIDLRPDTIVMDIGLPSAGDGLSLARQLRSDSRLADTPIVAVTGLEPEAFHADPKLFNAVFSKPVELARLVRRVKWLSAKSAVLRERTERARERGPELIAQSGVLLEKSSRPAETSLGAPLEVRPCPVCRAAMRFSERRQLEGVVFDYYSPCQAGCGLFCFDHSRRTLITLIE